MEQVECLINAIEYNFPHREIKVIYDALNYSAIRSYVNKIETVLIIDTTSFRFPRARLYEGESYILRVDLNKEDNTFSVFGIGAPSLCVHKVSKKALKYVIDMVLISDIKKDYVDINLIRTDIYKFIGIKTSGYFYTDNRPDVGAYWINLDLPIDITVYLINKPGKVYIIINDYPYSQFIDSKEEAMEFIFNKLSKYAEILI